jgi:hypothetical protein
MKTTNGVRAGPWAALGASGNEEEEVERSILTRSKVRDISSPMPLTELILDED